ncbi:uncharacterized protein F5Z01DRAFT_629147 [Emericellopsis atlantica]|uniref:Uncharacterized protein n=1 Tax=Emericellopsis atlantica TaxID=2614577 RepID=A0A9P7ZEX9_9HYPO|nr:uncharacterized protein F5Z01DRAFT_629147 [Emericellopsis atlantica]KAG9250567.1 hypothetical protein F5Z01DRAFT_629147 [Emericellopsis atlantica]
MKFNTLSVLSGLLLASLPGQVVATTGTCSGVDATTCNCPNTAVKRYQARSYTYPESLFPRTGDSCPDGTPSCCTHYGPGPLQVSEDTSQADLQCGKKFGDDQQDVTNGVTYTIEDCPANGAYAGKKCLHVAISPAAGVQVTDIHLQVDDAPITLNTKLGTWAFNKYCTTNPTECWVPTDSIIATFPYPNPSSLCDRTIYVAVGVSISTAGSGSATCFNKGTTIGSGNWFMYVQLNLECPEICVDQCCCPSTPPPTHTCDIGTAFGYGDDFKNLNGNPVGPAVCSANRWGWYFTPTKATLSSGITGTLIVGAGGNDVDKGIPVGTWSAQLIGSQFSFAYELYEHFDLSSVHVYASCASPTKCAPGQYTFKDDNLSGDSDTSYVKNFAIDGTCSTYYVIFHASVNKQLPLSESCPSAVE